MAQKERDTKAEADLAAAKPRYGTLAQRPAAGAVPDGLLYFATDDLGGTMHQAQAGAWQIVGPKGLELGYVEKADADFSTASVNAVDVPGLALTITARGRPFKVRAGGFALKTDAAGTIPFAQIVEGATIIQETEAFANVANSNFPFSLEERRNPAAGTVLTYKLQLALVLGNGATQHAIIPIGANHPAWLEVVER